MKRRTFIKTGLLFVPAVVSGQGFGSFSGDQPFFAASSSGIDCFDAAVVNWAGRVVANGGAAPSLNTKCALSVFYRGLVSASLDSKMIALNCAVPDSLIASITPLIQGPGIDPWTNSGFVSGDLTVNGLIGDGVGKYLTTGVSPFSAFANDTSVGLSIYVTVTNTGNTIDMGSLTSGSSFIGLNLGFGGTTYWDSFDASGGRISQSNSGFTGLVSANRTASNATAIYTANSGGFNTLVTGATSGGTRPGPVIMAYCQNLAGVPTALCSRRFSFMGIHLGLTSGEASTFYNLIQAMRTSLGGGFV